MLVEQLTIRDACPGDAEALVALVGQLGYPTSADAVRKRVERLSSSDTDRLVVAELDGEIVGLASLHTSLSIAYDSPAAKLSAIVVDERHRRGGNWAGLGGRDGEGGGATGLLPRLPDDGRTPRRRSCLLRADRV